jgi:glucokinase
LGERYRTLGVDVGGTNLKLAALWSDGVVIASKQIPTQADAGPEEGSRRLIDALRQLQRQEGIDSGEMRAIGLDCAGIVDPEKNLVLDSPNLRRWEGFPLAERLESAFGVPTFLENDVNAMAYGEWRRGAGRGTRHMLCLALGTGVGGGLILDGRLYRGAHGAAGELGHTTLDMHGPQCSCPNVGCLERHIGSEYIAARAREKLAASEQASSLRELPGEKLTPGVLDRAAEAGDVVAAQVFEEVGTLLGQGLVSLVNVFDPERVVLGGGVLKAGAKLIEPAQRVLRSRAMSVPARHVELVAAALGDDAALIGATLLAAERAAGKR